MILVDTSVIADVFTKDSDWFEWSSEQIGYWAEQGPLFYNAVIFAELAVKFDTQAEAGLSHVPDRNDAPFHHGHARKSPGLVSLRSQHRRTASDAVWAHQHDAKQ